MPLHVKDSSTWKQALEVHVKDGGVWKNCLDVFIKDGGTWKSALYEAGSQEYTTAGSYNFTVPAGVQTLTVTLVAGGGGGGSLYFPGDAHSGAGGGSGGWRGSQSLSVTPGEVVAVVVGGRGLGGVYPGWGAGANNGANGGSTVGVNPPREGGGL